MHLANTSMVSKVTLQILASTYTGNFRLPEKASTKDKKKKKTKKNPQKTQKN